MASPAVAGKALFVRTKTHLYRIERKSDKKGTTVKGNEKTQLSHFLRTVGASRMQYTIREAAGS